MVIAARLIGSSCALCIVTCSLDPVQSEAVADLGPEASGVPAGPLHRPDQPCLICHHDTMSVAGTLHATLDDAGPLAQATVTVTDSIDSSVTATTNGAGNFFIEKSAWQPVFPIHTAVAFGTVSAVMNTAIGREGSCAACHVAPPTRISAGVVYLVPVSSLLPEGGP